VTALLRGFTITYSAFQGRIAGGLDPTPRRWQIYTPTPMLLTHAIESQIKPLELVERLGLPVRRDHGRYMITCPYCSSGMWVMPSSFLCLNDRCTLLTGSVCELATGCTTPRTLLAGAARVQKLFPERTNLQTETTPENFASQYAREVRQRRRLLDYLVALNGPDVSADKAALLANLERFGTHRDSCRNLIFAASALEVQALEAILKRSQVAYPPLPKGRALLIIPYFTHPHELVSLSLIDLQSKTWRARIDLQPFDVAFAGAWRQGVITSAIYLHPEVIGAAVQNSAWRVNAPNSTSMAYLFGRAGNELASMASTMDNVHCVYDSKLEPTPANVVHLQRIFPQTQVFCLPENVTLDFDAFMFRELKAHLRNGRLNSSGITLLGSFNPQGLLKSQLLARFKSAGFAGAAEQLSGAMYDVEVYRSERTCLLETPDGYKVRRGAGHPELISNFTLQLQKNISFGDTVPLHHTATIHIENQVLETILPGRMLDSPRELQDHIQVVAAVKGSTAVPMLRDHGQFRNVAFHLRRQVPRLPSEEGLPFLGWDLQRKGFYAPGWRVTMDRGLSRKVMPFHPEVQTLDCYEAAPELRNIAGDLDPELATFVQMIIGVVVRAHGHQDLQCVQLRHDERSMALLDGLFRGLGQIRPLSRVERSNPALRFYPAWTTASVVRNLTAVREPYFVLSSAGRYVSKQHSHEELERAAGVLQRILPRVCETLMSATSKPATHQPSVLYSNGLAVTGHLFLEHHYGQDMPLSIQPYAWVEKWLKLIPHTELPDLCRYNFAAQKITIDASKFVDVLDMISLQLELRTLVEDLRVHPDIKFEMDAHSCMELFRNHYGRDMPLLDAPVAQ